MILGAGPEQCIAIQEAKSLGYEVFVADGDENAIGLKNEKSQQSLKKNDFSACGKKTGFWPPEAKNGKN